MKAYQLKIIVKNTKPPVWIRMEVQAGMTFSALSLILNHVYLLEQKGTFGFEFYQKKLRLAEEGAENPFEPHYTYDVQDAASTFIDTYFDTEKNFSYLSNDMKFRVEIEKTDQQYPLDFPSIIKFSGFPEDHKVVKNADEMVTGLQKFRVEYQLEPQYNNRNTLAEKLPEEDYRIPGMKQPVNKPDNMKKSADTHLKEFADMVMMKIDSRIRDISTELENFQNSEEKDFQKLKEIGQNLDALQRDMKKHISSELWDRFMPEPEIQQSVLLKDSISVYTKSDLMELAKELHLRSYSSFSKAQLAEKIANALLSSDVMRERMGILEDSQIELFEKILEAEKPVKLTDEEREEAERLEETEYLYFTIADRAAVPADVKEKYRMIDTPEFQRNRQERVWLMKCVKMVYFLYGIAPLSVVRRIYRKKPGFSIDMARLKSLFEELPEEENLCCMIDGKIVDKTIVKDKFYLEIEERQRDEDFYIPSCEEIEDYTENWYPSRNPYYQELMDMFIRELGVGEEKAVELIRKIYIKYAFGYDIHDTLDLLQEQKIIFPNEEAVRKGINLLMQVNNNTRMVYNRGYTQNELAPGSFASMRNSGRMPTIVPGSTHAAELLRQGEKEIRKMGFSVDFDSNSKEFSVAGDVQSGKNGAQTKKIYPNDPCPCGSGKKFKKCCGKNR